MSSGIAFFFSTSRVLPLFDYIDSRQFIFKLVAHMMLPVWLVQRKQWVADFGQKVRLIPIFNEYHFVILKLGIF